VLKYFGDMKLLEFLPKDNAESDADRQTFDDLIRFGLIKNIATTMRKLERSGVEKQFFSTLHRLKRAYQYWGFNKYTTP